MVVVDSSVWIDYFNGRGTLEADLLERLLPATRILIGDLILAEVLQGFRSDLDFKRAIKLFDTFEFRSMVGREIAVASGQFYRALRIKGITVRKTIGALIAAFCITEDHHLLHSDRDFDVFERHLGLLVLHP